MMRVFLKYAFLLLALCFAANSLACEEVVKKVFEKSFNDKACYIAGQCEDNAYRILERLNAEKVDLSDAQVIYLRGISGIAAREARDPLSMWSYHVIVQKGKTVLDLDYTKTPQTPEARDYFIKNYPGEAVFNNPREMARYAEMNFVFSVPAKEFFPHYPVKGSETQKDNYRGNLLDKYPVVDMGTFINQL